MTNIKKLLDSYPIISEQVTRGELEVLLTILDMTLTKHSSGAVVEFGCYAGTTSLFITRLLKAHSGNFDFHVYDSFSGLPEKNAKDINALGENFIKGELSISKNTFVQNFKKAGLPLPIITKCWFESLDERRVPEEIVFAFLDGDFYTSILSSLSLVWPRLTKDSVVVVDDYANDALPGAKRAVDEWLEKHPASLKIEKSLAIIKPKPQV